MVVKENPDRRKNNFISSPLKNFGTLMMEMVRCGTEADHEQLWDDYNKAMSDEPFLPKKFGVKGNFELSITRITANCSEKRRNGEE